MRYISVIILCLFFGGLFEIRAFADDDSNKMQSVNSSIDEALSLVKAKKYNESVQILKFVSGELFAIEQEITLMESNPGNYLLLLEGLDEAITVLNNDSLAYESKVLVVLKFRFLTDALISPNEPMWKSMKGAIEGNFLTLNEAINQDDEISVQVAVNELLQLMEVIRPSVAVSFPQKTFKNYTNEMNALDEMRTGNYTKQNAKTVFSNSKNTIDAIFLIQDDSGKIDEKMLSFIIIIGCIVTTLGYVGWRKYLIHHKAA